MQVKQFKLVLSEQVAQDGLQLPQLFPGCKYFEAMQLLQNVFPDPKQVLHPAKQAVQLYGDQYCEELQHCLIVGIKSLQEAQDVAAVGALLFTSIFTSLIPQLSSDAALFKNEVIVSVKLDEVCGN